MKIGLITEQYDEQTDEVYRSDELEPTEEITKDFSDLVQEASKAAYERFQEMLNTKLLDLPSTYKIECLEGNMKCAEFMEFEKELRETLKGY